MESCSQYELQTEVIFLKKTKVWLLYDESLMQERLSFNFEIPSLTVRKTL